MLNFTLTISYFVLSCVSPRIGAINLCTSRNYNGIIIELLAHDTIKIRYEEL